MTVQGQLEIYQRSEKTTIILLENMLKKLKILVVFVLLLNCVLAASVLFPLTTVVRTPEDDKATVESARINGNFAYRTEEGHAYKTITPLVGHILAPDPLQPVNYFIVEH